MMKYTIPFLLVCVLALFFLPGCTVEGVPPTIKSDSRETNYDSNILPPFDMGTYTLTGEVLSQQVISSEGGVVETAIQSPPFLEGKSLVKIRVEEAEYTENDLYVPGSNLLTQRNQDLLRVAYPDPTQFLGKALILKVSDAKAQALSIGERLVFVCRVQYEGVAALLLHEVPNTQLLETNEFDWCRMKSPVVESNLGR